MRKILQKIFRPFFVWLGNRVSSAPSQEMVFKSLTKLYKKILEKNSSRGILIDIDINTDPFIIFSDQHKGVKDRADDFKDNEPTYIAALNFYYGQKYCYINLGDAEELWKYSVSKVIPKNTNALKAEANFHTDKKYYRTFGNHDLLWKNTLDVQLNLKDIFEMPLPVYEGIILRIILPVEGLSQTIHVFLTHGHQGDKMSDNNAFSTWVIAHIWAPIQRVLQINLNTPAKNFLLRDKHNRLMYEWSSRKKNTLLITGHTHKPVFASGKYAVAEAHKMELEYSYKDVHACYFNTGCCCYNDGDITGIEIAGGYMRLIKWHTDNTGSKRFVLEEKQLKDIVKDLR